MEKVQLALERLLPELRDLERKKVFTKDEIHDIVAKRREFERALATRDVKPVDFVRYIEYEQKLEKLRRKRAARIQKTTKRTLSDHSIAAHVTQLHRQSVRRFPESISLWNAFISHTLTQESPTLVSRTLSSAIAMHPTHVDFWVMASRWESEGDEKGLGGGNTEGARRLCMRALRFLKGDKAKEARVWREWIRLETSFAEKTRARWALLGIGKGKNGAEETKRVKLLSSNDADMDVDEDATVDVPALDGEDKSQKDEAMQEAVSVQAKSGQEAIIDGAIVRVVIDSCLNSYKFSLPGYELVINILRELPTRLRLSLLDYVYESLRSHFDQTHPQYAQAISVNATRFMSDFAFNPEQPTTGDQLGGEAMVDAVGKTVDEFWKACKGRKGKAKNKDKAPTAVWEEFCSWITRTLEQVEDEALREYLASNLDGALLMAPASPVLAVLRVKYLLQSGAASDAVMSAAAQLVKRYGTTNSALEWREKAWVAFAEAASATAPSNALGLLEEAIAAVPWSGKVWDVTLSFVEGNSPLPAALKWYDSAVPMVLLSDAVPPVNFESAYAEDVLPPRELVSRRFIVFLAQRDRKAVEARVESILKKAPALGIDFLRTVLDVLLEVNDLNTTQHGDMSSPVKRKILIQLTASEWQFRRRLWDRAIHHPDARAIDWVDYAKEALCRGEISTSQDVIRTAQRTLTGPGKLELERQWADVVDA
ncbi:U3 snoRNP protein [Microbotryomycetes sp. JL201]|nr:U3 snoRNP protein [Microbotryomycetes sp. JL201]